MRGPGYPSGVPTPYTMHVNPYPTRFHGGIWSRPAFKFPSMHQPTTVFLPPRDIDMIPDKPPGGYSGLGNDQSRYNVGDGIFRPGGYGGGVFDGNLAGAPSLGSASARTLGDAASDASNFPYGMYSAQTKQIQDQLNQKLTTNGFCPLIADGKLGPATCGAAVVIGGLTPGPTILAPATCTDFKQPSQASAGCGTGPAAPPSAAITPNKASLTPVTSSLPMVSSSTKKVLGFVGGGLLAIGAVYYIKKRRGRR